MSSYQFNNNIKSKNQQLNPSAVFRNNSQNQKFKNSTTQQLYNSTNQQLIKESSPPLEVSYRYSNDVHSI